MIIKAYVFNTKEEVTNKIAEIDLSKGYPSAGANTYCSYEFNNEKWIVKYSPNIDMDVVFGYEPVDFEYKDNYPYYIAFDFNDNILKIYTYDLYPEPFRVIDITTLSSERRDIFNILEGRVLLSVPDCTEIKFIRKDELIRLESPTGDVDILLSEMSVNQKADYDNVGDICNELVEV